MRKHLVRLMLVYLAFEAFRRIGNELPTLFASKSLSRWLTKPEMILITLPGLFIFLLYPVVHYVLFDRFFRKSKKSTFLLSVLCIFLIITLRYFVEEIVYYNLFRYHNYDANAPLYFYYIDNVYYAILYSSFGIVYFFLQNDHERQIELTQEALEKKQAQLAFLQSQINPHFLFNSLNNIYSLISWHPQKALPAIADLSELMRYSLSESVEKVALSKELAYIDKYIHLQSLRFEQQLIIEKTINGLVETIEIPPFLLITLIENAFKHGSFTCEGPHIRLALVIINKDIHFYLMNKTEPGRNANLGIGLPNVRKRLALLYPDKHSLSVINDNGRFEVKLKIPNE